MHLYNIDFDNFIKDKCSIKEDYELKGPFSDASGRLYFRVLLLDKPSSFILAYYPIYERHRFYDFINMAKFLNERCQIKAPKIYVEDYLSGLMLIEDFGDYSLFNHLKIANNNLYFIYKKAVEILHKVQNAQHSDYKFVSYNDNDLIEGIVKIRYYFYYKNFTYKDSYIRLLKDFFYNLLSDMKINRDVLSLRDYHSPNIFILNYDPEKKFDTIGLIDFQDAGLYNRFYDLASILYDSRIWINDKIRKDLFDFYYNKCEFINDSYCNSWDIFQTFALFRNLNVLGVFARQSIVFGNDKYLKFIPLIEKYIISIMSSYSNKGEFQKILKNCRLTTLV
ncbi:phosphotransferase [Anaplasmataceae bacterium AB001_6]|nr:phosphotransferase [Anaplasmataceae bacterium AB001_6]